MKSPLTLLPHPARNLFRPVLILAFGLLSLLLTGLLHAAPSQATLPPGVEIAQSPDVQTSFATARQHYELGQYSQAVKIWQQLIAELEAVGESQRLNRAMALSNLSLTYQALGQWTAARENVHAALTLLDIDPNAAQWQPAYTQPDYLRVLAQGVNIRGKLFYLTGQVEAALADWQAIQSIYRQISDLEGEIGSILNQAQAYQALGQYLNAEANMETVEGYLDDEALDDALRIRLGQSLGTTARLLGDLEESITVLNKTKDLLLSSESTLEAQLYLEIGNTYQAQAIRKRDLGQEGVIPAIAIEALDAYGQAIAAAQRAGISTAGLTELQTTLSQFRMQIQFKKWLSDANATAPLNPLIESIDTLLRHSAIPISRQKLYAQIGFAETLMHLLSAEESDLSALNVSPRQIADLLGEAAYFADDLQDTRTKAYAIGWLGELYAQVSQSEVDAIATESERVPDPLVVAKDLTQQAIWFSTQAQAPDIRYQWHRQMGQLLEAQGQREDALKSYRAAVADLRQIRSDLLAVNSEVQFSFRDNVEPLYREFIELLIKTADSETGADKEEYITQALESFDELQLAEINNFLGCDSGRRIKLDLVEDPKAAIVYAITLSDQIAVILDLPSQTNSRNRQRVLLANTVFRREEAVFQSQTDLFDEIREFREAILDVFKEPRANELSKDIYKRLFEPVEEEISRWNGIDTLVFVLDGDLRNISLAALSDEQGTYLIEKYNLSITPGIDLFEPKSLPRRLNILLGGIAEAQPDLGVGPIPQLDEEILAIRDLSTSHQSLIGPEFKSDKIRQSLLDSMYSVIHFKTHGQFSSDPQETFIVGFEELIRGREFGNLIQAGNIGENRLVDLLTLSSCQAAQGDNRAVLGITGVAVRAGARSIVSALWNADIFQTTLLMNRFYAELFDPALQNSSSRKARAEALRTAQLELLYNGARLSEWAPYVLVGNWR